VTPFATLLRVLRSHVPRLGVGILEDSESSALWRVDQLHAAMEHQSATARCSCCSTMHTWPTS
jgi:hypothetical protein